jgi:Ca2+-binding EF-hand superfamily protein
VRAAIVLLANSCSRGFKPVSLALALTMIALSRAADSPPDAVDLLILRASSAPIRVRLHVNVEELPFRHHWKNGALELFRKLDRDGDGKLADAEITGLPWPAPKGDLSQEAYLSLVDANSPPVEIVQTPINPRSASGLFLLLDRNGDGALEADELKAAPNLLDLRDFDDDGVLSYDELIPPYKPGEPRGAVVIALNAKGEVSSEDVQKYGKRLGEDVVSALPKLAAEVWLPLGRTRLKIDASGVEGVKTQRGSDSASVDTGDVKIDVNRARTDLNRASSMFPPFQNLDVDKNVYLDATELKSVFGDQTPAIFKLLDADEDGRAGREEYHRYIMLRDQIRKASIFVQSTDLGQEMFAAVDADRDGRLTRFELTKAVDLLTSMGSEGRIGGKNFPVTLELLVGGASSFRTAGAMMRERPRGPPKTSADVQTALAPAWFHEMDRNGDGAVERVEFIGPAEQFKKCDANGDGLIRADEAKIASPKAPAVAKPRNEPKAQTPQKRPLAKN